MTRKVKSGVRPQILLLVAAALAGCSHAVSPIVGPAAQPPVQPAQPVVDNNFVLTVSEAVANEEQDLASYTKVYIDNQPAGQTDVAPRSRERTWGTRLPEGNHLVRLEQWFLPTPGEWTALAPQWQPHQRFVRVELGLRTLVALKFRDGERRYALSISREPMPGAATQ